MKKKNYFFDSGESNKPKKEKNFFSEFMKEQDRLEKKQAQIEAASIEKEGAVSPQETMPQLKPAKTTKLVLLRQYNTYQALLEIIPQNSLKIEDCFAKSILYIMQWFRKRLGEGVFELYPEISFLKDNYPVPESFADFSIEKTENIEGLNFIDLRTSYDSSGKAWLFFLTELDNGQEKKDIIGRTFKTEIAVYLLENTVVLGVREACIEPRDNNEDAFGFRPAFIRDMSLDEDFLISEQGLGAEYAFTDKPVILNGKSGEACEKVYKDLIASDKRQMPVLFIPGQYYENHKEEVNANTKSLLGYCHVVVCQNTCRKLFSQNMQNEEFADVAEEGQMIFYRTNAAQQYPTDYYEESEEDVLIQIKQIAQREPIRKQCDFREFSFEPSNTNNRDDIDDNPYANIEVLERNYSCKISSLNQEVGNLKRDNDILQRGIDELKRENKKLDKDIAACASETIKCQQSLEVLKSDYNSLREDKQRVESKLLSTEINLKGIINSEKERYLPLINLPSLGMDKKEQILKWIDEYYSDVLTVHPDAKKSFMDDSRNIDWHRFCMMIHYLAGYTRYRNEGGTALNPLAAREYDPEEAAYTVTPASGGTLGATEVHKDKYTILLRDKEGTAQELLLDLHIKFGKGSDSNMIRIYFHYSAELKKSIIGYMPGHLPTKKDAH